MSLHPLYVLTVESRRITRAMLSPHPSYVLKVEFKRITRAMLSLHPSYVLTVESRRITRDILTSLQHEIKWRVLGLKENNYSKIF